MIKLGTWQGYKPKIYKTYDDMASAYANHAYNDGVKGSGWSGYIVVRNPSSRWGEPLNIYHYANEPTTSWLAKFKIVNGKLEQM